MFQAVLFLALVTLAASAPAKSSSNNTPKVPGFTPTAGLTLKKIGLGSGNQKYNCDSNSSKPSLIGAEATLTDVTSIYESLPENWDAKTAKALRSGDMLGPFLGHHQFENGVAIFHLGNLHAEVTKVQALAAPKGADKGILNTGAVPWIELKDDGKSMGVKEVFRVNTAGGAPQACSITGKGDHTVPYAALYWFYG